MFSFLKKKVSNFSKLKIYFREKAEQRKQSRFVWTPNQFTITEITEFDPTTSLTLTQEEINAFKKQEENKNV